MLGRFVPILGTLLMTRATTKVAGRHAGKLALALGVFELWRTYRRSKTPAQPLNDPAPRSRATERPSHRRRPRR